MADQLMIPRFEVIDDYPNSPFDIGEIIDNWHNYPTDTNPLIYVVNKKTSVTETFFLETFKKYPRIFQPLMWYEKREINELPKYLMNVLDKDRYVIEVVKYEPYYVNDCKIPHWSFYAYIDDIRYDPLIYFNPATAEEYNVYILENKK